MKVKTNIKAGLTLAMMLIVSSANAGIDPWILLQGTQGNQSYENRMYQDQNYYQQEQMIYQQKEQNRLLQEQILQEQQEQIREQQYRYRY